MPRISVPQNSLWSCILCRQHREINADLWNKVQDQKDSITV